jgi:hypothetical protein
LGEHRYLPAPLLERYDSKKQRKPDIQSASNPRNGLYRVGEISSIFTPYGTRPVLVSGALQQRGAIPMIDHPTFSALRLSRIFAAEHLGSYAFYIEVDPEGGFDIETWAGNDTKSSSTASSSSSRPATATNSASWKSGAAGV